MTGERTRLGVLPATVISASVITVVMVPAAAFGGLVLMDPVGGVFREIEDALLAAGVTFEAARGFSIGLILTAWPCVLSLACMWVAIHWLGPRGPHRAVQPVRHVVAIAVTSAVVSLGASVFVATAHDPLDSVARQLGPPLRWIGAYVFKDLDDVLTWAIPVTGPTVGFATIVFGLLYYRWTRHDR